MSNDNVINFPNKDHVLSCLDTVIKAVKDDAQEDDAFYQVALIEALISFWDEYEDSIEILSIKQGLNNARLNIISFIHDA